MILTHQLIPGGYRISLNGRPWIDQPFDPSREGHEPFEPEAAEAAALALIAELEAAHAQPEVAE